MIFLRFLPLVCIPFGYLLSRFVGYRKPRYWIYGFVLLAVCFLDWYKICFVNKCADTVFLLVIATMICDAFWSFNSFKKPIIRIAFAVVFIFFYCNYFSVWLFSESKYSWQYFKSNTVASYSEKSRIYRIDSRVNAPRKVRTIMLFKKTAVAGVEHMIGRYTTANGYYNTPFSFVWSSSPSGIKVDLVDGTTVVWSLGENLQSFHILH